MTYFVAKKEKLLKVALSFHYITLMLKSKAKEASTPVYPTSACKFFRKFATLLTGLFFEA